MNEYIQVLNSSQFLRLYPSFLISLLNKPRIRDSFSFPTLLISLQSQIRFCRIHRGIVEKILATIHYKFVCFSQSHNLSSINQYYYYLLQFTAAILKIFFSFPHSQHHVFKNGHPLHQIKKTTERHRPWNQLLIVSQSLSHV